MNQLNAKVKEMSDSQAQFQQQAKRELEKESVAFQIMNEATA